MHQGSLCVIKSKKNSTTTFVLLYPDIEEILHAKHVNNEWLPSMLSDPAQVIQLTFLKQLPRAIPATEHFIFLEDKVDDLGKMYYRCLCKDIHGWIIGSRQFDLVEKTENHAAS